MGDPATIREAASANGRGDAAAIGASPPEEEAPRREPSDLDARDPDFVRATLPAAWRLASLWFRGEVRGLDNVPVDRPALLVGNCSGGNVTPDSFLFTLAFHARFGAERALHQLTHDRALGSPVGPLLRRYGAVAASHAHAQRALSSGAAVLVYPGGEWEVHRPSWEAGRIDFAGRTGFVRLALNEDVPIVPVVAAGGQETALFLNRGDELARRLGLDRLLGLRMLPISLAAPWGLNVGDLLGHLPLPAKLTIEVLPPIELRRRFGPEPDVDEAYAQVTRTMQDALDALYAERRFPVIG